MHINSSSIHAHTQWHDHSAHNVANVNTSGFHAHETHLKEQGEGSVSAFVQDSHREGVELARESSEQILAQRGVEANAQTIKTYDDVLGTVLNIKA